MAQPASGRKSERAGGERAEGEASAAGTPDGTGRDAPRGVSTRRDDGDGDAARRPAPPRLDAGRAPPGHARSAWPRPLYDQPGFPRTSGPAPFLPSHAHYLIHRSGPDSGLPWPRPDFKPGPAHDGQPRFTRTSAPPHPGLPWPRLSRPTTPTATEQLHFLRTSGPAPSCLAPPSPASPLYPPREPRPGQPWLRPSCLARMYSPASCPASRLRGSRLPQAGPALSPCPVLGSRGAPPAQPSPALGSGPSPRSSESLSLPSGWKGARHPSPLKTKPKQAGPGGCR
ncbi:uncharacterized protein LOC126028318 [Suncus etruscus]|uniref:uncharacterized protein LOC126028318 n=1 Tax=Suncus etruscus TaxID=109475 RepID=UPI00210F329D|nr:uncharacterized protein LOC126028318 [Suncus etruscus]